MKQVKIHTSKDTTWTNASGDQVPVKFVPKSDKVKEVLAGKIHKAALNAEAVLAALHEQMKEAMAEVKKMVMDEYQLKYKKEARAGKGSFLWYNFDKSLKIEAKVDDIVKWDNSLMTEALTLLNQYLDSNLTDANILIKNLVNDAFANSKGMIDSRKVFQILKYEKDIKNAKFQKACELMKAAQGIDTTKLYMRVWEKTENGEYRNINLNFSSI
jgi:hypothetical protein